MGGKGLIENLLFSAGGGFAIGALAGYALKHILKLAAIILGVFFLGLTYLAYRGWIHPDWQTIQNQTLFLQAILESKKGVYFDGSNTTSRILDVLEEERPKIICIDELEKMPRQFQNQLLNFMESVRKKEKIGVMLCYVAT